jgi:fimbrial isopeptide formation D2 family protein
MKKLKFLSLLLFLLVFSNAKAQYVTISDTAMVTWLTNNYPSAMVGNQMDTTDVGITTAGSMAFSSQNLIQNLNGIQYFDAVLYLYINSPPLTTIPAFPPNLLEIVISGTSIQSLPSLPLGLLVLNVEHNDLTSLPFLPSSLGTFYCGHNNLSTLPALPQTLINLACINNNLTFLPNLPSSLTVLNCDQNNLVNLPPLPPSMWLLSCYENNLTQLPILPSSLIMLFCNNNNLDQLPNLPQTLTDLFCHHNNLSSLPNLPSTLNYLDCGYNDLTGLPEIPSGLTVLDLQHNLNLTCLPILPETMVNLNVDSTNVNCFSNPLPYIINPQLPLCLPNNINGCITNGSISGALFNNSLGNCINNGNMSTNASFHLFDNQNNFLQSRSSSIDNHYYFSIQSGTYKVRIDSTFSTNSVSVSCPISSEQVVTALQDSIYTDRDFGVHCIGEDLGVEAIVHEGIVFPGQAHSVKAILGDLSQYLGLSCASGTGGTVQITITGPSSYTGHPSIALSPIVNGNSYSYTVSDFGTISLNESFVLNFLTDTTALAGNSILVTVTITSDSLDSDSTNNSLSYTYFVVNSYDPNMKEVNPVNVLPGYEDYFTYTVHFQNLGSAPAFNIRIKDTIDSNLDLQTLRVINASHNYYYNLSGDLLTVHFPNIMLADSASNPAGSKGFVQYQVKPKANLPHGTNIENTAHIFFDYNTAVVTNTTANIFVEELSIQEKKVSEFLLYPNPSSGQLTIVGQTIKNEVVKAQICDLTGKVVMNESLNFKNGSANLETDLASGSYILVLTNISGTSSSHRLVIRR